LGTNVSSLEIAPPPCLALQKRHDSSDKSLRSFSNTKPMTRLDACLGRETVVLKYMTLTQSTFLGMIYWFFITERI
jgi:hypothetical protein